MRCTLFIVLIPMLLAGCQTGGDGGSAAPPTRARSADAPVAYIDGRNVQWEDLRPSLVEAQGAEVLADYLLDHLIQLRLREHGMTISPADLDAERQVLLQSFSPDPDEAERILRQVRRGRGLGEMRFTAALRRSAGLRKLVQGEVHVTEDAVELEYERVFGTRYQARLIMVPAARQAAELHEQLRQGASFIDLAIAHSVDPSRAQAGLLPPISPLDVTFPVEIRQAVERLEPGQISLPIAMEAQWAILKLERKMDAPRPPLDEVRDRIVASLRRNGERIAQERLAREMVADASIVVFDPVLGRLWNERKEELLAP